ncbi:MAG: hypothetical protein ACI8PV_000958 [Dinoroseobacter sp.]|jgi:hypothetical protein
MLGPRSPLWSDGVLQKGRPKPCCGEYIHRNLAKGIMTLESIKAVLLVNIFSAYVIFNSAKLAYSRALNDSPLRAPILILLLNNS